MSNTALPTFEFSGYTQDGQVAAVRVMANVDTPEQAAAIAATFPKWLKVIGTHCSGWRGESKDYTTWGIVSFQASLTTDGVNKGINETGLKRLKRFLSLVPYRFYAYEISNPATPEQLKALIA